MVSICILGLVSFGGAGADEFCFLVVVCIVLGVLYYLQMSRKKPGTSSELSGIAAIVFFGIAAFSTCFFLAAGLMLITICMLAGRSSLQH